MKKILCLLIMISILSVSAFAQSPTNVFNTSSGTVYTDVSYIQTSLVNQDPYPADPGAYVNLLFKIENRGTVSANNVSVELLPEYPFSLDPGVNPVTNLGTVGSLQIGNNAFLVNYNVRVDENAINGENEIKLKYSTGDGSTYNNATFDVDISNPRTTFAVIAQDASTLAIANTGNNTAMAVIIGIPDQPNFRVNGTTDSILGNLNAGDYTLATFQIIPVRSNNSSTVSNNLTVEVSYTDTLGIRRTVDVYVPYNFATSFGNGFGNTTGRFTRSGSSLTLSNGLLYIVIGVVGIVVIVVIIKIRTRKKK